MDKFDKGFILTNGSIVSAEEMLNLCLMRNHLKTMDVMFILDQIKLFRGTYVNRT